MVVGRHDPCILTKAIYECNTWWTQMWSESFWKKVGMPSSTQNTRSHPPLGPSSLETKRQTAKAERDFPGHGWETSNQIRLASRRGLGTLPFSLGRQTRVGVWEEIKNETVFLGGSSHPQTAAWAAFEKGRNGNQQKHTSKWCIGAVAFVEAGRTYRKKHLFIFPKKYLCIYIYI